MQLPFQVSRPSAPRVPDLRIGAADGAVLQLRRDGAPARTMRLTGRCMELLRLLSSARWLTTGQVHRRFFACASIGAARRRLRILAHAGYVRKQHEDRMREALFALGIQGKRALEREGKGEIGLERRPPKEREHMTGIGDIRIAAEMAGGLEYFFAASELPGIGWKFAMVPD